MCFCQKTIGIFLFFFAVFTEIRAENDVVSGKVLLPVAANSDLKLGATTDFEDCDIFATDFIFTVRNESNRAAFTGGVYFIDWGDGSAVQDLGDFTTEIPHTYPKLGQYTLRFSVQMGGTELASQSYTVSKLAKPGGGLGMAPSGIPCIDSDAEVKISGYEDNTPGTMYVLDFGDKTPMVSVTQQEVVAANGIVKHRYTAYDCSKDGSLSIKLKITNECGHDVSPSIGYSIVSPPAVDFTFPDRNCSGEPVQFSNTTEAGRNPNCDTITNFTWDFDLDGDGVFETHSNQRAPKITYPKKGIFKVRLTGENGPACSRKVVEKNIQILERVRINWTPATSICEGKSMVLDASASTGEMKEYYWSVLEGDPGNCVFESGQNSEKQQVLFKRFGKYKIQLYLTNGCSDDTKEVTITVKKDPEVTHFDALTPICPSTVGTGVLDLRGKVAYEWYDNEEKPTWTITPVTGWTWETGYNINSLTPKIKFTTPGDYTLTVSVEDVECGATPAQLQKSQILKVYDPTINPDISVDENKTDVCENEVISFTNNSTGVQELKYQWIILKGGSPARLNTDYVFTEGNSSSKAPKLTFLLYGDYTVTANLVVECSNSSKVFAFHVRKDPEIVRFDPLAMGCKPYVLNMRGVIHYEWYNNTEHKLNWTIEGPSGGSEYVNSNAQSELPIVKFSEPGTYKLTVKLDGAGCRGTRLEQSQEITILDPSVRKDITIENESSTIVTICENEELGFINNTQSVIPITYSWIISSKNDIYPDKGYHFTRGSITDPAPKIAFTRYGVYTVVANLTTDCNQGNPTTETFVITVQRDPEVTMSALEAICPADMLVLDETKVTYKWNDNTAKSVYWEVKDPDGSPAGGVTFDETALYPQMKFTYPGTYTVSVNLEQPVGCSGAALNTSRTITIHNPAIDLQVEAETYSICEGAQPVFKNTSTFAEPVTYLWTVTPVEDAPADGWQAFTATDAVPVIRFMHYGKYKVKVVMTGRCDGQEKEMEITVRKDPSVSLKDYAAMCPDVQMLATAVDYTWRDNIPGVKWTVNTLTGSGTATGDLTGLYPAVTFPGPGTYEIIAELTSVGCPADNLSSRKVLTVYPPDIKMDVQVPAEVKEGETVAVVNHCIGEIEAYEWSFAEGPVGGAEFVAPTNSSSKEPEIRFTKFGEYKIKLLVSGTCTDSTKYFNVVVKGVPEYNFEAFGNICAGSTLDMKDYLECEAKGATITALWTLTPSDADHYEYINPDGRNALLPVIHFKKNGHYTIILEADAEFGGKQSFTKEVNVLAAEVQAATLADMAGCTDLDVQLENYSVGDSLQFEWMITPANEGWNYTAGTSTEVQPSVRFTQRENYTVKLRASNICTESFAEFTVRAYSKPEIDPIADIRDVCERGYVFKGNEVVKVNDNGDAINHIQWSVTPAGYHFADTSGATSLKPDITFEGGVTPYRLKLEIGNGCAEKVSREFTILIDDFEDITPLRDTAICALTAPMLLKAQPEGGRWATMEAGMIDSVDVNKWYFNPHKDLAETFEVIYSRGQMSCVAHDTMMLTVHKLPVVSAGADLGRCVNLPPLDLGEKEPAGGEWRGNGVNHGIFDPALPGVGDWKLEYWYTDPVTACPNLDTITMTVHPLPDATFKTAGEHCRNTDSLFIPNASIAAGNTYSWNFGDGNGHVVSQGEINYRYNQPGFYDVILTATSPQGCILSSAAKKIEVFNLPPAAEFTMSVQDGCGPLDVKFSVDPGYYDDPSAHLSYMWLFGNGETTEQMQPSPDVRVFLPMAFDTTYQVTLKVYNICRTETQVQELKVFSSPKPYFLMSPEDGCSPLDVSFINLSEGTGNKYKWNLGNGKTSTEKNPQNTYTAGGRANFYEIILNAENRCNAYEYKDTLMVKPNTLNAVFRMDRRYICAGDTVHFTNYSSDTSAAILNQRWEFGDGQYSPAWDTSHCYEVSGKMGVTLLVDNGCAKGVFTDTVRVFPIPVLKIESEDKLCEDDTFHFELKSDQPLKNITWEFGDGGKGNSIKQRHIYENPGIYEAKVAVISAEIASCPSQATKSVEAWPKPDVKILPLDTVACSPFLYNPELIGDGYFKWDYGTGEGLTSENEHLYVNDTNFILDYNIVAYVETNRGCKEQYRGHIKLYNSPKAGLDKDISYGRPEKVTFVNLSKDYTECIWYLPDGRIVNSLEDQTLVFEEESEFPLSLVAINQYGCRDSLFMGHKSYMSGLFFPNTFIPHSNNPKVNKFKGIGMGLKEYNLSIYDMYSNKVWETNALLYGEPAEGWDGCNLKGEPLPQGVYMWRAKAVFFSEDVWTGKNNGSGKEQATQGTVLLMRE